MGMEGTHATAVRSGASSHRTGVLVAWGVSVALLVALFVTQVAPISSAAQDRITALFTPIALCASLFACVRATVRVRGRGRRLWLTVTLVVIALVVGSGYRGLNIFLTGLSHNASAIDDVAFLMSVVGMIPLAIMLAEHHEPGLLRTLRGLADFGTILLVSLTVLIFSASWPLGALGPHWTFSENALALIFPVLSLAVVAYPLAFKRDHWFSDEVVLSIGMVLVAAATVIAVVSSSTRMADPGRPLYTLASLIQLVSALCWGIAAAYRFERRSKGSRRPAPKAERPITPGLGAQVLALLTVPGMIFYASATGNDSVRMMVSMTAALLAVLVVGRSILVNLENRQLAATAITDPLTGLFNDRYFRDRLQLEVEDASRDAGILSVVRIHLDGIESFTEAHGYSAGDRRMKWFAGAALDAAPDPDLVFRLGADDFAWIMPEVGAELALEDLRRLRVDLTGIADGNDAALSFTAGVALFPDHATDAVELLRFAEGALYWALDQGPGTCVMYDPTEVEALDSREHVQRVRDQSHSGLVESLAQAVDARDPYTRFHSSNVARLAHPLALAAGLDSDRAALLAAAALLHDVGKIGVPDAILRKPAKLTEEEYAVIKEHPALGVKILSASARPEMLAWIHQHHEHWDGSGYPAGLAGEEISLEARILGVCDAYDAITTDRPYRDGTDPAAAVAELRAWAGIQFDARLVELLAADVLDGDA